MSIQTMEETLFPVKEVPAIFMEAARFKDLEQVKTGYKFIVREDTGDVLSCMTDQYQIVDNKTVVDKTKKVLKGSGAILKEARTFSGGSKSIWTWTFPKTEVEIRKGDIVHPELIIKNSYDGSTSVDIMGGAFRLVCLNGLTIGNVVSRKKNVHKIYNQGINNIDWAIEQTLKNLNQIFDEEFPTFAKTKLHTRKHIADTIKMIPSQYLEEFTRYLTNNKIDTYWDLLNAATHLATHTANRDKESTHIMESKIYPSIKRWARA